VWYGFSGEIDATGGCGAAGFNTGGAINGRVFFFCAGGECLLRALQALWDVRVLREAIGSIRSRAGAGVSNRIASPGASDGFGDGVA